MKPEANNPTAPAMSPGASCSVRRKYSVEIRETVTVEMEGDDHCDDDIMERALEIAGDFPNAIIIELPREAPNEKADRPEASNVGRP